MIIKVKKSSHKQHRAVDVRISAYSNNTTAVTFDRGKTEKYGNRVEIAIDDENPNRLYFEFSNHYAGYLLYKMGPNRWTIRVGSAKVRKVLDEFLGTYDIIYDGNGRFYIER